MKGKHKNDEVINALLEKFNLGEEDVFEKRLGNGKLMYRIIPRKGIDKIEHMSGAKVWFEPLKVEKDHVVFKFFAEKEDENGKKIKIETTGEADNTNVMQKPAYLAAMAESRGRARAILKIEGFYKYGFFSEDEADEFKDFANSKRGFGKGTPKATVKEKSISEVKDDYPSFLRD